MRKQQKLKSAQGQILGVNQVHNNQLRSSRETTTPLRHTESFSSTSLELETTTCTKSSEMSVSMELSPNSTWRCLETTEPITIPST